jgi:uroporphyrinogen-III synthase
LADRGAHVIEMPLIEVTEPDDAGSARDEILDDVGGFDWVVVTSPNGAARLAPRLGASPGDPTGPRVAVVGRATEAVLGRDAALVAEPARGAALVEQFPAGTGRVLVLQGDLADDTVARGIASLGWEVTTVVAYRTVTVVPTPSAVDGALAADALLLASASAARAWAEAIGTRTPPVVVCIGPSTSSAAEALGITVAATAERQSIDEMVACLERVLNAR